MFRKKEIKNSDKYQWTEHAKFKMAFYGLSPQRAIRVIRSPRRTEEGIVDKTIAVMQPQSMKTGKDGKRTWGSEIWVMYQLRRNAGVNSKKQKPNPKKISNSKTEISSVSNKLNKLTQVNQLKIISVWRYPGISPKRNPIPDEILREINEKLS